jgi:hypothetical protein
MINYLEVKGRTQIVVEPDPGAVVVTQKKDGTLEHSVVKDSDEEWVYLYNLGEERSYTSSLGSYRHGIIGKGKVVREIPPVIIGEPDSLEGQEIPTTSPTLDADKYTPRRVSHNKLRVGDVYSLVVREPFTDQAQTAEVKFAGKPDKDNLEFEGADSNAFGEGFRVRATDPKKGLMIHQELKPSPEGRLTVPRALIARPPFDSGVAFYSKPLRGSQ